MAEKKPSKAKNKYENTVVSHAVVTEQPITATLETNYMPYAMSVIISRAIPEIDGFKPSHRKLLYMMYKEGLLGGRLTKSNTIVGNTMKLNPHGDAAIYDTLVRLTTGHATLLHPFIESKGAFGKHFSKSPCAASRYTEARLDKFCETIFAGLDKDAVDFIDNYDGTMQEPTLLPTAFPNILVAPNKGIAVGLASDICSFNLAEICDATIELIRNPKADITDILIAPDFSTGGFFIYNREKLQEIYRTGRGSFKLRARYSYNKKENCIEITQIPYTTKVEDIIDTVVELAKKGKLKEITDIRDETGLEGLRIAIDLKRGSDHEQIMQKLYKLTTLEDSFTCNFTIIIGGSPRTLGVYDILEEWIAWRTECVKRELYYNLTKMREKLHLLEGLAKILLDIDKAIKIIRETEHEKEVVPNLCTGFGIDEVQAEYIAEIKLRNINKEYILNRISDRDKLKDDIAETEEILSSDKRVKALIIKQLTEIKKKYAKPRLTQIIEETETPVFEEPTIEVYPVTLITTRDGYIKKLLPKGNLPKNDVQKLKDNDIIVSKYDVSNEYDLLVFTDKCQVYKAKLNDFDLSKPSQLGDFLPASLSFDEGENVLMAMPTKDYSGYIGIFFENGKAVKIKVSEYATKTNRKKLTKAFSSDSPAVSICFIPEKSGRAPEKEFLLKSSSGKAIIINSDQLTEKATRTASGVIVFTQKKGQTISSAVEFRDDGSEQMKHFSRYRKSKLPSTGTLYEEFDLSQMQISFDI